MAIKLILFMAVRGLQIPAKQFNEYFAPVSTQVGIQILFQFNPISRNDNHTDPRNDA